MTSNRSHTSRQNSSHRQVIPSEVEGPSSLTLFDQRAYAECRRELVIALVTLIGRVRGIYPTPESVAACADVEATLCGGAEFKLAQDERQLSLWRDAA